MKNPLAYAAAAVLPAVCAISAGAQAPAAVSPASAGQRTAVAVFNAPQSESMDGFIRVRSYQGDTEFRTPVMSAAAQVVDAMATQFKLKIPRGEAGLVIFIRENGAANDTRVIETVVRTGEGRICTHVTLPSPGYCSLRKFRRACAKAFFRAWVDRNRKQFANPSPELPEWVVDGVLRTCSRDFRLRDASTALELWRSCELPCIRRLFPNMRPMESDRGAALCGVLALWMRETPAEIPAGGARGAGQPQKSNVFRLQLERLTLGIPWNAEQVLEDLTGTGDPQLQELAFDERMARYFRAWLAPGRAAPWDAQVFASRLSLIAPFWGGPFSDGARVCSFKRALALYEKDETVRVAAALAVRRLLMHAEGRGPELKAAAAAYAQFLEAVVLASEPRDKVAGLLFAAEEKLAEASEAASRPPPEGEPD